MPQFAVFMHHPADRAPVDPATLTAQLAEHDLYAREMTEAGILVYAAPLADPNQTVQIRAGGDQVTGPWPPADDVVVGFYVIEAPDLANAVDVAGRNPILGQGGSVEVRPTAF